MKIIKLLLLGSLILIYCCSTQQDVPPKKYYKVYKKGHTIISKDCPEFKKMVKEGQIRIQKECAGDCYIYLERELYNYILLNQDWFFSDLCLKTKSDVDAVFGFETRSVLLFKEKNYSRIYLNIFSSKRAPEVLQSRAGYWINEQDSIFNFNQND